MIAFLFSPLARYAAIALTVIGALTFIYAKGYSHGSAHVQRNWDAAVARAIERGTDARAEAEREIEPVVDQPAPASCPEAPVPKGVAPRKPAAAPVMPRWLRDDQRNRDNR